VRTNSSAVPSETSKGGSVSGFRPLPFDVSTKRKTSALDRELTTHLCGIETTLGTHDSYVNRVGNFNLLNNNDQTALRFTLNQYTRK
jgi:hypothetical protein